MSAAFQLKKFIRRHALWVGSGLALTLLLTLHSGLSGVFGFSKSSQGLVQRSLARFVTDPPKEIRYPKASFEFDYGVDVGSLRPEITGGSPNTFKIHPDLPEGLRFDFKTGEITGTPAHFLETSSTYTVTASNRVGSASSTFEIKRIRAPKPRLVFAQRSLVLNVGDSIDVPVESLAGPYAWARMHSERYLPKGIHYDERQKRLVGRVESTEGFSFQFPTRAFFLRAKGYRSYSDTAINITLNIPRTAENRQYAGDCLNVMDLLRQMKSAHNPEDLLSETVAAVDGAEQWIPSPAFMTYAISRFRLDKPLELQRKVTRSQWLHDFGYEVQQHGCNRVFLKRPGSAQWVTYQVDEYHSGVRGIQEIEQEHRLSLVRVTVAPHFPERLDFSRVTRQPSDERKQPRDYLVIRAEINPKKLSSQVRCDGEERAEKYKIRLTKTVQLGILRGKGRQKFADGGPSINPAWFAGLKKMHEQDPESSCRWINY